MKKLIALLLAVVMALGMAACAKTGDNSGPVIDDQSSSAPESSTADDEPVEVTYVRGDDEVAYENALANYEALLAELEKNVASAVKHGVRTRNDLLKVKVKLNQARLSITRANNGYSIARMNLCRELGLPLESNISV